MVLPDYPIEVKENDRLRRYPLAVKVADLIHKFKGEESFVIGIEGEWGSGKTSFVNLVLVELNNKPDAIIVKFNPWNFNGQNELISDFFATLLDAIKNNGGKKLYKKLLSYSKKLKVSFSPSLPIPGLGSIGMGELWGSGGKTLIQERAQIDKALKSLTKKIVVVIDDIDRLDAEETRLVLKLVKMTANFPNTIFILAYDRKRVAERLQKDNFAGNEYLKKIIQVSFTLPKPDEQGLREILFNDLDETIAAIYGEVIFEKEDERRWNGIRYSGFDNLFKTVRDIKRYISSLRLDWSIVGGKDVNMVDFMTIEAIRVFAPEFYSAISYNKSLFTKISSLYIGIDQRNDDVEKEKLFKGLLELVPKEIVGIIEKICRELFPQLKINTHYADDFQQLWRVDRRICSPESFDFYLQLGIPNGAVSESEVEELIKTITNTDELTTNIVRLSVEKRLRQMLTKITDRAEKLTEEQSQILILALWLLEKTIDDGRLRMFDFNDTGIQVERLLNRILEKVIAKEKRVSFLKNLLNISTAVYYPTMFITALDNDGKGKTDDEGSLLLRKEVEELKVENVKLIEKIAESGILQKQKNLNLLLLQWSNWGDKEKVKKYIKDLVSKKEGLLDFIKGYSSKVFSTAGDYITPNKKEMGKIYPIETIEELVAKISDDDIEKMNNDDKKAIKTFKNPPKGIFQ